MTDRHLGRDLLLLLLGQVVVLGAFRMALPADLAANEGSDYLAFYRPVAGQLADGDGLVTEEGEAATRYPPGYPVVLAATFVVADVAGLARDSLVTPLTIGLTATAGLLLHLVARRVLDRRHAWATSAVWLGYPLLLWTAKQPNSEIPYLVALYGVVLLLVPLLERGTIGGARLAAAGALLGVGTVVRPAGLLLVPAFAVVLWRRPAGSGRAGLRLAAVFVAAFAVPVLTASAWMSLARGERVLVSDANDVTIVEGLSFAIDSPEEAEALPMPGGLRRFVVESQAREGELLRRGDVVSYLAEATRERPVVVAQLVAYKAARSWYGTESFRFEGLLALTQVVWVGATVAGIAIGRRRGATVRWYTWLALSLTAGAWWAAIATLSIVRYLVPTLGLLAPLVAVALLAAVDRARGRPRDPAPRAGTAPDDASDAALTGPAVAGS
ncbi:MAG: glycosyltransferase family 39 protein [Acidimicrobiales bacterium]|nr:glycosyltransferase family 39 protein [Acidimicrobiales bacterium]